MTAVSLLILFGSLLSLLGSVGLARFPDFYSRLHAVTKTGTLGVTALLVAGTVWSALSFDNLSIKLLVALAFQFLTAPVGAHMLARSAMRTGVALWSGSVRNDLSNYRSHAPFL